MNIKTLMSGIALTAAMTLSGSAFAQTVIGTASVSAADLPAVQARCTELKASADTPTSLTSTSSENGGSSSTASNTSSEDGTAGDNSSNSTAAPAVDEATAVTTTFDLTTLTVENCTAAGLLTAN